MEIQKYRMLARPDKFQLKWLCLQLITGVDIVWSHYTVCMEYVLYLWKSM